MIFKRADKTAKIQGDPNLLILILAHGASPNDYEFEVQTKNMKTWEFVHITFSPLTLMIKCIIRHD